MTISEGGGRTVGGRVYSTAFTTIQATGRVIRSGQFFTAPQPATEPKTALPGMGVLNSVVINELASTEGTSMFEVMKGDDQVWLGTGEDRAQGLLLALLEIADMEAPE